jgi:hypothetical protein
MPNDTTTEQYEILLQGAVKAMTQAKQMIIDGTHPTMVTGYLAREIRELENWNKNGKRLRDNTLEVCR